MSEYDTSQSSSGQLAAEHQHLVALNKLFYEGYVVSRAIYVVAVLGIADILKNGPLGTEEIAAAVGTKPDALYRLLRATASVGVFVEVKERQFVLTPLAACLRSDLPGSLREYVCLYGGDFSRLPADNLNYSVQTGKTAFEHVFGTPKFPYLDQNPKIASEFYAGMASISSLDISDVLSSYDFSGISIIADIGGGNGGFLASILNAHANIRGILLDRPFAVEAARIGMEVAGLLNRCELIGGDFFDKIPGSADAYVLKSILHDWDDARAIKILRNCHDAMSGKERLLIIEPVILSDDQASMSKLIDLMMLVMTGGRERTEEELRMLLEACGFELTRVIPTGSRVSIVESVPIF